MKKIITIVSFAFLLNTSLMADFLKIEMGAGAWLHTPAGEKSYTADSITAYDISSEDENINPYVWLLVKQPVPLIPNLRLEYVSVSTEGTATGRFEDFETSGSATQLDLTQYDIIPYYNLLDNTFWITLDVGLDIKVIEVNYEADGVDVIKSLTDSYSEANTIALPLLYVRSRIEVPATNIGLEADVKYVSYNSSKVYDIRAKIDYTFDFIPLIQPAVEVGYRMQKYDIDDSDIDGVLNLEFSGLYAGVMLRF